MELSHLPRTELVRELLSSEPADKPLRPPRVRDTTARYLRDAGLTDTLQRKLSVARELLMRDLQSRMCEGPVMASPQILREWLCLYCNTLEHEVFLVMYLNVQNRLIEAEEVFRGSLTQTSVYPREIVKGAILRNAASVVLAHNHPSGSTEPSRADEALTMSLKTALALVDVRVLDHMVVAGGQALSFAERGLL